MQYQDLIYAMLYENLVLILKKSSAFPDSSSTMQSSLSNALFEIHTHTQIHLYPQSEH